MGAVIECQQAVPPLGLMTHVRVAHAAARRAPGVRCGNSPIFEDRVYLIIIWGKVVARLKPPLCRTRLLLDGHRQASADETAEEGGNMHAVETLGGTIRRHESGIAQLIRQRDVRLITHAVVLRIFGQIFLAWIFSQNILSENPYRKYMIEHP